MRPDARWVAALLAVSLVPMPASAGKPCGSKGGGSTASCPTTPAPYLVAFDDFENGLNGWPAPATQSMCGGSDHQLGAVGAYASWSLEPVQKTYAITGKHTQLRVQATVYFLDKWQGETATLAADGATVWVDSWHHCPSVFATQCAGINVCGDADVADRIGRTVDIIVPHTANLLTLSFKTGLVSLDAGLAVDDIRIWAQ